MSLSSLAPSPMWGGGIEVRQAHGDEGLGSHPCPRGLCLSAARKDARWAQLVLKWRGSFGASDVVLWDSGHGRREMCRTEAAPGGGPVAGRIALDPGGLGVAGGDTGWGWGCDRAGERPVWSSAPHACFTGSSLASAMPRRPGPLVTCRQWLLVTQTRPLLFQRSLSVVSTCGEDAACEVRERLWSWTHLFLPAVLQGHC